MRRLLIIASFFCAGLSAWGQATYRYWFDRDETAMQTGSFTDNHLQLDIPTEGLTDWYHILHLQMQDDAGNWSAVISRLFAVVPVSTTGNRDLSGLPYRYWFDRDETNIQTGTLESNNLLVDLPTEGLSDWFHIMHIQTQDDAGNWSPVISRSFAIVPASTAGSRDLTGQLYQYWFDDNFDAAVEGTMAGNVLQLDAAVEGLADGVHVFYLRTRDDKGNWSSVISRKFSVGGNFGDIVPWGQDEPWEATYLYYGEGEFVDPEQDASGHHWMELDFDDSAWETLTGPMATAHGMQEGGLSSYHFEVADYHEYLLRRKFTLDELSIGRYYFNGLHDDEAIIYVNGQLVSEDGYFGRRKVEIPHSFLKEGENLIALHYYAVGSPNYLDYSISCEPVTAFDINVTSTGNGTVSLVDSDVRNTTSVIQAKPKTDVTIAITPDRGNLIQSVMLDEVEVTNQLVDGKLTLPNLLADHTLSVTFISTETMATVILPKGVDEPWQMKYIFTENYDNYVEPVNDEAGHSWKDLEYDDSEWQTLTGPMGTNVAVSNFEWGGVNNCFNLRRKFTLDAVTQSRYILQIINDDNVQVYLNGHLIMQMMDDWSHEQYLSYAIPSSAFVEGENILAIWINQNSGGTALDYSLISAPLGPSDYTFTDTQGLIYALDYQNLLAMVNGHKEILPEDITIPTTLKVDDTTWPVFGFMPNALADAALSSVHVEETIPYAIPANAFSDEVFSSATLIVPPTALDAYKRTAAWSNFDQIVPCVEGTLVPWGYEQPWTARYLFFEDESDFVEPEADRDGHVWSDETFDDSAWQTLTGPMANNDQFPVVNHTEMGENSAWLLRRTFHVNRLPLGAIHLNVMHDDDIRTYVNGKEIDANSGTTVPRSLIHEGDNTIAFYYHVITPPDYIDYSFGYLGFLPQEGDANNDATIDLGDLVQIVSHITGTTPSHFNLSMADVKKDGEVNAADLVALVNLMMGEGTEIAPARLPSLQTEAADVLTGYVTADGRLCFDLHAVTAYTACQLTLSLPAGADIKDVRLAAERSGGHVVTTGRREDGRVVVLVYSTANKPFLSQNGLFLEGVAQMANNGGIDVEDILFVTPKGTIRHFDSFSIDLASGVASVKQEQHSDAPTYDLAGRRVGQRLKKGIYIQKGRKKLKN